MQILHLSILQIDDKLWQLRGSLAKSVPLYFGLDKTLALYFYHQYHYSS